MNIVGGMWVLVLVYNPFGMMTESYATRQECLLHSLRLGEELKVSSWDNMNGANPKPRIAVSFCVEGYTAQ